ncbi:MAG: sulfur carrier protein ThiS [Sphingomonas bacterium]|nr:sulfur carrier protein ThiS [Sphingomonas bacterium]
MSLDTSPGVTINGEPRRAPAGTTLAQLLAEIGLDPTRVAVERNLEIVPRSTFGEVMVEDGDAYEIVHFVGGG